MYFLCSKRITKVWNSGWFAKSAFRRSTDCLFGLQYFCFKSTSVSCVHVLICKGALTTRRWQFDCCQTFHSSSSYLIGLSRCLATFGHDIFPHFTHISVMIKLVIKSRNFLFEFLPKFLLNWHFGIHIFFRSKAKDQERKRTRRIRCWASPTMEMVRFK